MEKLASDRTDLTYETPILESAARRFGPSQRTSQSVFGNIFCTDCSTGGM